MKLPDALWRRQPGLDRLLAALGASAGDTRFVGGAVRDTLLGLPVEDIDLATRLAPDESLARIEETGFKAVPTGIAHGTVTAVLPEGPVEVTTLRRDLETDGRRATVAFTDDWRADAARRDFTINALFADPVTSEIADYFGGECDLQDHRVRFIGEPRRRIAEDHLRILRFFRFHARFGRGDPDAAGLGACAERANDLMALSRERIADELFKLLAVADPVPTLALMLDHDILKPVLPEIAVTRLPALAALVTEEARSAAPSALRRLAALLPADRQLALAIGQRLRLSKAAQKRLVAAAARSREDAHASPEALAYRLGVEAATDRLLLAGSAHIGLAAIADWRKPTLGIGGGDLIAMGVPPGRQVATTLQAIERAWIAEGFPDHARVRALAAEALAGTNR